MHTLIACSRVLSHPPSGKSLPVSSYYSLPPDASAASCKLARACHGVAWHQGLLLGSSRLRFLQSQSRHTHTHNSPIPLHSVESIAWFGEEAKRVCGDVLAPPTRHNRFLVLKQPVGVVGAITPWVSAGVDTRGPGFYWVGGISRQPAAAQACWCWRQRVGLPPAGPPPAA